MNGYGIIKNTEGDISKGYFINGQREGYCSYSWNQTGDRSEGYWKNGLKDGYSKMIFANG